MFLSFRAINDPLNEFRLSNVGRGTYFGSGFKQFSSLWASLVPKMPRHGFNGLRG